MRTCAHLFARATRPPARVRADHNFPRSCCTSVNEVICHGIPDSYELRDGDLLNIDVTVYHGGYHGDCSETYLVGAVDEAGRKLVKVTYDCWQAAIDYCRE